MNRAILIDLTRLQLTLRRREIPGASRIVFNKIIPIKLDKKTYAILCNHASSVQLI